MTARTLSLLLAAAGLFACASAGGPRRAAASSGDASVKGLVHASVQVTFYATVRTLSDVPIEVRIVDEGRGLIESQYFDLTPFAFQAERYPPIERIIRYVINVAPDTLGRGSRILIRALYQPSPGPYVRGRATERLVPRDHPAVEYAEKLLGLIEKQAGSGS